MPPLSVVIIGYNEEKNIGACIDAVRHFADEVILLDSFSTDATLAIARSHGALIRQSYFHDYISQKKKAIQFASHEHVLLLDADEIVDEILAAAICEQKAAGFPHKAYSMNRCSIFCGRYIRRGLWYPDKKLRLFDRRAVSCGGLNPHDRICVHSNEKPFHLSGELIHHAFETVAEYHTRNRVVSYTAARSIFEAGVRKHWSKIVVSPLWAFLNGYLFRLGFLDGKAGWIIAVNTARQSFWKYRCLRQLQRADQPNKISLLYKPAH
ncbi:MAG: glycosyltransferase family 2 protein [Ferruginibacter sp.]